MVSKGTIFIVPGFRQSAGSRAYRDIARLFKEEGYRTKPVNITWSQSTISENTDEFIKKFKKIKAKRKFILGFSYGAMIAFIGSKEIKTEGVILCSLSPYFQEDLRNKKINPKSELEAKRFNDFIKFENAELSKKIKTKKLLMLYGRLEARTLIKRVHETFEQATVSHKYLLPIKNTEHNIADKKYIYKIQEAAKFLQ